MCRGSSLTIQEKAKKTGCSTSSNAPIPEIATTASLMATTLSSGGISLHGSVGEKLKLGISDGMSLGYIVSGCLPDIEVTLGLLLPKVLSRTPGDVVGILIGELLGSVGVVLTCPSKLWLTGLPESTDKLGLEVGKFEAFEEEEETDSIEVDVVLGSTDGLAVTVESICTGLIEGADETISDVLLELIHDGAAVPEFWTRHFDRHPAGAGNPAVLRDLFHVRGDVL